MPLQRLTMSYRKGKLFSFLVQLWHVAQQYSCLWLWCNWHWYLIYTQDPGCIVFMETTSSLHSPHTLPFSPQLPTMLILYLISKNDNTVRLLDSNWCLNFCGFQQLVFIRNMVLLISSLSRRPIWKLQVRGPLYLNVLSSVCFSRKEKRDPLLPINMQLYVSIWG